MANAESIRQIARSRAPLSTWLAVVLIFALVGVIVLAIIGPMPRGRDYEERRAKKRFEKLKTVREDAEKALNTYAWIDKNKGVVQIPISRAMDLTTAQLAQQKPAPAGPIATPQEQVPAAPSSPAPAGSPKPGATQPATSPAAQTSASASPPTQTAASPSPQAATSPSPAGQSPASATAAPAAAAASPSPSKSP